MRSVKAYRYRWVILLSLVLLIISVESQWLTLAPVGRVANTFYRGQLNLRHSTPVDLLSLMYLVVFVVASVPSSYLLHRLGIRWVVWIASGTIIFGALTKTLYLADLRFVLFGQFFLAVGQTLVLVSITEIVSRWFPIRERGMAVGLTSTSQYLSLAMVMIVTPLWVVTKSSDPMWGSGFERMMRFWGIFSAILALVPAFLIRENPPTPSSHYTYPALSYRSSFKALQLSSSLRGLLIIFSICWGVLMVFFIKVDQISALLGITDSNGILGISMFVGGMVGATVLPALSDRYRRRKLFFVFSTVCSIPGILLMVFSARIGSHLLNPTAIAIIGSSIVGLSLLAAIPIGTQYAAELASGVGEEIIQSLLLLSSQAACAIILVVSLVTTEFYAPMLLAFLAVLLAAAMVASAFLKESPMIITEDQRLKEAVEVEIVHLQ